MGSKTRIPAEIDMYISMTNLIDAHHWLPQDIRKIPFKDLQMYCLIAKHGAEAKHQKEATKKYKDEFNAQAKNPRKGGGKRFTKTTKLTP